MNVQCPHCGESMKYRHELASQPQACTACKRPIQMPPVEKLPKALQEEYRKDLEWERKDAEAKRHKEEVRQQKEAERALRQQQKEEERAVDHLRMAAEQRRQAAWEKIVEASQETTPEEAAVSNRYPALVAIARVIKIVVVLVWVIWLVGILANARDASGPDVAGAVLAFQASFAIPLAAASLWFWAMAEIIQLLIDVANDLRVNRFLLKAIRYQQHGEPEKSSPHLVSAPAGPTVL